MKLVQDQNSVYNQLSYQFIIAGFRRRRDP